MDTRFCCMVSFVFYSSLCVYISLKESFVGVLLNFNSFKKKCPNYIQFVLWALHFKNLVKGHWHTLRTHKESGPCLHKIMSKQYSNYDKIMILFSDLMLIHNSYCVITQVVIDECHSMCLEYPITEGQCLNADRKSC